LIRRLGDERGYSLVEVMVSIMILTISIIPMVGMFDMGLNAANRGSEYDKARTLANRKLEQAKGLTFDQVKGSFPVASSAPGGAGSYTSSYLTSAGADFTGFEYKVEKQYLTQPPMVPTSSSQSFSTSSSDQGVLKVSVTVRWGGNKTYSTSGVVARTGA
jgi:prepilin-type N-terminal cleavage/methylation domain-containing protein